MKKEKLDSAQLVEFAEMLVERRVPVWYKACCEPCTIELLDTLTEQYPFDYTQLRRAGCINDTIRRTLCTDSAGILKGFFWTNGGESVDAYYDTGAPLKMIRYRYGFPDIDAFAMKQMFYQMTKPTEHGGVKSTMPDVPGIVLFRKHTLGIYVGEATTISALGNYVERAPLSIHDWESWSYIPSRFMTYGKYVPQHRIPKMLYQYYSVDPEMPDIKQALYRAGFYGCRTPSHNMVFDEHLQDAVRAFQERLGVIPTGDIDSILLYHINRLNNQN